MTRRVGLGALVAGEGVGCRSVRLVVIGVLALGPLRAQIAFEEVGEAAGIASFERTLGYGSGASAADYDGDGLVDLFVATERDEANLVLRNLGGGQFVEQAALLGLGEVSRARGGLWFDYTGDGRLDLLVTNDCFRAPSTCDSGLPLRLFEQQLSGSFVETTMTSGLLEALAGFELHRSGAAAGDLNGDGYLDLVTSFWSPTPELSELGRMRIWLNQRDGTFAEVPDHSGIDDQRLGYWQATVLDCDGDGLQDIYVTVDFGPNRLWRNLGPDAPGSYVPVFEDVAAQVGAANDMNDMGLAVGDYDNDGDPDFYASNIFREGLHNVLLRQDGANGTLDFSELAVELGVDDGGWGWGATFLDADNDGDLDLAETNGWRNSGWESPPRLFVQQPPVGDQRSFLDEAANAGLVNENWGSSLLSFDYDLDGDLDLLHVVENTTGGTETATVEVYRNQLAATGIAPTASYLLVRPRMPGPNTRAIGARVSLQLGTGAVMTRWITAGSSFLGQEPAEAFFGTASEQTGLRLEVRWPDGSFTVRGGVGLNQVAVLESTELFSSGFELGHAGDWALDSP